MRLLIKLAIVGLVVHACWRAASAYYEYYEFRDAVMAAAQQGGDEREVQARVVGIASTMNVPVAAEQINVRRDSSHTLVDANYVDQIEILPTYRYPWEFKVSVDAWKLSVPKASDLLPSPQ